MGWAKQRYKQAKRNRHERSAIRAINARGRRILSKGLNHKVR